MGQSKQFNIIKNNALLRKDIFTCWYIGKATEDPLK
jgi:hypothetical protein